jgi:cell fate regulator YaaT (PSP1 superfamily)
MPIMPLPLFEADLKAQEEDRKAYEKLKAPKTLVVRYSHLRAVGEFPYDGSAKPGCGSKIVIRSPRGTEIGEMLTSTCPNAGCSKSVTRKEMLQYIENSGGREYPFFTEGRALRVATPEDLAHQTAIEASKHAMRMDAKRRAEAMNLPMKIVEAEPILGGERLTFYFTSEERVDFRDLVRDLAAEHKTRIDMRQVGARDEARITADYERCGQHCCCKQFLKVLKPVSMKSAKQQKATLDPLKISGRCGRLMCCLRYEDQTYEELAKRLPRKKSRVGTPEGDGIVLDTQILTQLALVQLEGEDKQVAVPVEELTAPSGPPVVRPGPVMGPGPGGPRREMRGAGPARPEPRRPEGPPAPVARPVPMQEQRPVQPPTGTGPAGGGGEEAGRPDGAGRKRRRRRRGRGRPDGGGGEGGPPGGGSGGGPGPQAG